MRHPWVFTHASCQGPFFPTWLLSLISGTISLSVASAMNCFCFSNSFLFLLPFSIDISGSKGRRFLPEVCACLRHRAKTWPSLKHHLLGWSHTVLRSHWKPGSLGSVLCTTFISSPFSSRNLKIISLRMTIILGNKITLQSLETPLDVLKRWSFHIVFKKRPSTF